MAPSPIHDRRAFLRLAAGAGALGLGTLLAGCGSMAAVAPTPTPAEPVTITIWNWMDDVLVNVARDFERRNPQIKVNIESARYDQAHTRLLNALQSGTGAPDVAIVDLAWIGAIRAQSGLADLGAAPFDGAVLKNDFLPWAWDLVAYEGHLLGLPCVLGIGVAWYRADVLTAAGLPSDPAAVYEQASTWDGWAALDEALRRKNPKATLVAESMRLFQPAVAQQGIGWVKDGKLLVEQKGLPAAELLARFQARDIPPELPGAEFARGVIEGTYAGMVDASWMQLFLQRDFQKTAGAWRIARAPGGDFAAGAAMLCIPQQSRVQEAAWAFVRDMCASVAGPNMTFQATGALPAYKAAWNDPLYDQPVAFFGGQRAYRLLADAAARIPFGTPSPFDQRIDRLVNAEARQVASGSKKPAAAMADAAAAVRQQIPELAGAY